MTALADVTDPRFTDDQRAVVARFDAAVTPPEVREARVVEEVARALGAALRDDLGERGLNWEPGIDVARRLLADPRVAAAVAAYRAAQDGGAEETVDEGGRVLIGDAWVAQASREALQAECTRLSGEAGFHLGRAQKAEEAVRRVEAECDALEDDRSIGIDGDYTDAAFRIREAIAPQAGDGARGIPISPPRAPHNPPKPANYHPYA